jgi:hypothetical protein
MYFESEDGNNIEWDQYNATSLELTFRYEIRKKRSGYGSQTESGTYTFTIDKPSSRDSVDVTIPKSANTKVNSGDYEYVQLSVSSNYIDRLTSTGGEIDGSPKIWNGKEGTSYK